MSIRDELTILQKAAETAVSKGWEPTGRPVVSIDYITEPPSLVLHIEPVHESDNNDVYLAEYFPIFENSFAIAFWGRELAGDAFFGTLPAWMYHQHRMLSLLQWEDIDGFFNYLALGL